MIFMNVTAFYRYCGFVDVECLGILLYNTNRITKGLGGIAMQRDFRYLRDKYGDAGARDIFEKICTRLLQAIYNENAHNIRVSRGDEGIDILVGTFDKPIKNFQCKYFLDGIDSSQKQQIRDSFNRAISSSDYKMEKWTLCVPCIFSAKEFVWWSEWKGQQEELYDIEIALYDGGYLISQLKEYKIYNEEFDEEERIILGEIYESIAAEQIRLTQEIIVCLDTVAPQDYDNMLFVKKLECAKIEMIDGCKRDFFNAEIAEHTVKSKGDMDQLKLLKNLQQKVFSIWQTQYRCYQNDTDGNDLLTRVYERIENLDASTLACLPLPEVSLMAKQGMLHQWAEKCSIGWLRNYKEKLDEYLKLGADKNES